MNENNTKTGDGPSTESIIRPGHNCWKLADASRTSVIVDAAAYFAAFAEACESARRQILILGWDFDRLERLHRGDIGDDAPDRLGEFLVRLVRRRRGLRVYLLSWDFNMIYAAERELLPALRMRLQAPPRFHFRLDNAHPGGASQHQKVVVIDDCIAFVGGIDLSRWRWDTPDHAPADPRRIDPDGKPYPPFHDLMMLVEGDAAARLGELARERWRRSHGWRIKPPPAADSSPWPPSVEPGMHARPVAIARTEPVFQGRKPVQEVKQLYLDAIAGVRRFVYIENQYFTARSLGQALSERLAESDGPEVVLVLPRQTGGWLEQITMDVLRTRVVACMRKADRHGRLRVYYPHQPGLAEDECISVHAKLMIVDDRLLRVGSSNTSNRSMGLDSECDLAVEAEEPGDPVEAFIRTTRRRLLGEHLDCGAQQLEQAETQEAGLIAAIEGLMDDGRSLRPLDCAVSGEVDEMVPDSELIDPHEPFSPDYFVQEYVPPEGRPQGRRRLWAFLAVIAALLGLAAAWRWTPLHQWLAPDQLSGWFAAVASPQARALAAVVGFLLASLLMVPLTLLAVISGIVFQGWEGFAYIGIAALGSSSIGFAGGRFMSRGVIERLSGSRIEQLSRRLAERGTVAVALLRLVPIAPFTVFNLVAGASHLGFRQFIVGSTLGMGPGLAAITLFSSTLWGAVTTPTWSGIALAAGIGAALALFAWLVKRWLRSG